MTVAKRVEVSADGITYYTLPGHSGSFNDDGGQITDTIFGQTFTSTQPGLITWTCNANAFYKGFAGYVASVKSSGDPINTTGEAMTLVSGKTYKVTDATKNVWDHTQAITVKDGGTPVSAANFTVDWLFGKVTFISTYTVGGAVTVDVHYLPVSEVTKASSFTLTQTAATIDHTDYAIAHGNDGYRVFEPGLRTISLQLGGFYDSADHVWTILEGRSAVVIEINPDGSGLSLARGIFKLVTRQQSGDVGALEQQTRTFNLSVPENMDIVFNWQHDPSTTLSAAIRVLLNAYINQELPYLRYMPDGFDNIVFAGRAVTTDVSLSSGLDAMNEFTANFQGSDRPTRAVLSD